MSSETIFTEVDEELRRDRLRKVWRTAAPWVIGAAVAVVVGVAGYEGWNWWQKTNSAKWSDQFYAAMTAADGADAAAGEQALTDLIAQAGAGYPVLGQFRKAALLAREGKPDEALAAYDSLAAAQTDKHLRELALVLGAQLLIDKGDVAGVQQRVGGLLAPDSTLRNAAQEAVGLAQYKAGDLPGAMASFQEILADTSASRELRTRIQIFVAQLLSEGAKLPEAPAAEEAAVDEDTQLDVTPPAENAPASSEPASN